MPSDCSDCRYPPDLNSGLVAHFPAVNVRLLLLLPILDPPSGCDDKVPGRTGVVVSLSMCSGTWIKPSHQTRTLVDEGDGAFCGI